MNNNSEAAVQKFLSGYNCAQAVLYSFSDEIGIAKNTALKIASGFGAGMGRTQEVCGAVTGAVMAISMKHGRGESDDYIATEQTYKKTRELMDKFQTKHGSCICRELLNNCDLTTEEGQKYFKEHDLKNIVCRECVRSAVQIAEEMM